MLNQLPPPKNGLSVEDYFFPYHVITSQQYQRKIWYHKPSPMNVMALINLMQVCGMYVSCEYLLHHFELIEFFSLTIVCVWVVHILKEGIVMSNPTLAGLRLISIRSCDCTFNVHDYHSGNLLLSWDQAAIRRSGYTKSLVFLEASKRCREGPGLIWMHHPLPQAKELRQCLHE